MYNRYVPQPDGSYRKNQVPDPTQTRRSRPTPPPPSPEPARTPLRQHVCEGQSEQKREPSPPNQRQATSAGDFLRQLLPKDLDTGDLLIIVLLLLMASEHTEDKNTALLTLALYLIM